MPDEALSAQLALRIGRPPWGLVCDSKAALARDFGTSPPNRPPIPSNRPRREGTPPPATGSPRRANVCLLCRGVLSKTEHRAEEYGKASVHTRLHNPENTGAVVQTTSENDTRQIEVVSAGCFSDTSDCLVAADQDRSTIPSTCQLHSAVHRPDGDALDRDRRGREVETFVVQGFSGRFYSGYRIRQAVLDDLSPRIVLTS